MKNFKHQGDVVFIPVAKMPVGKEIKHNGSDVLALGETTGHKHVIMVALPDQMFITVLDGNKFITLLAPGTVTHEEHKTITLDPGIYRIGQEREKDWFALTVHKVID